MTTSDTLAFGGVMYPEVAAEIFVSIAARDAPITASLIAMQRKRETTTPEVKYKGQDLAIRRTQIDNGAGYDETDTALVVDDASIFVVDDLVLIEPTGETILVTGVNTGTETLTVVRSVGTVDAAAITDNDFLYNSGPAKAEGSSGNAMRTNSTTTYTSYTRIFERVVELTRSLAVSGTTTEDERMRLRKESMLEIARDIEFAAMFDQPGVYTGGTHPRRFTQGIFTFAGVNVADANGTLTEKELDDWLGQAFAVGSDYKIIFGSSATCGIVRRLKKPLIQGGVSDSRVGFTATRYATPDGEFELVKHPHMVGEFATELLCIDPSAAEYRFLTDSDLKLYENVQASDDDAKKDKWLGELGFTWGNPQSHARLTNIVQEG
jgi:hypothetical protein